MKILIQKLNDMALIPCSATCGSAGLDLHACLTDSITISPGQTVAIPCGFAIEIPNGFFAMVTPRSGLALKHGITVLNSPGIIDSDYRGEVKCILSNFGKENFVVENGMRIAQMIIASFTRIEFEHATELSSTARGAGGFGHTGVK